MKNLLLLAFAAILLFSCTDVETNNPAFQGSIDNVPFKATDSRALYNVDGSFSIQGVTVDETMTLKISSSGIGTYNVGGTSNNYATLENSLGIVYSTNPEGTGKVIVTSSDPSSNLVSGTFNFTAMVPGVDTIRVHNGVFYEVRYSGEDGGDGENPNAGALLAKVDGNEFSSLNVTAEDNGNSILLLGSNNSSSISLKVPVDVENGTYDLPGNGFSASYVQGLVEEVSTSGTITIINHDVATKSLSGTFYFVTVNHTIEQGQFNVIYQ